MLVELRYNVMAKDFFNYIRGKQGYVYMNENTLRKLIDQIRVCRDWGEEAVTTDEYINAARSGITCLMDDFTIKYDDGVMDGYMRAQLR